LTEMEYRSARATVNTAFFKPWVVARTVYQALERLGFNGRKALEPLAGTGIFLAAQPKAWNWNMDRHGVEIDTISGGILRHLQPVRCGNSSALTMDLRKRFWIRAKYRLKPLS
jgi:hypothetical protein